MVQEIQTIPSSFEVYQQQLNQKGNFAISDETNVNFAHRSEWTFIYQ